MNQEVHPSEHGEKHVCPFYEETRAAAWDPGEVLRELSRDWLVDVRLHKRETHVGNRLPSGNQTSQLNISINRWFSHFKPPLTSVIFHCHVWLPEGMKSRFFITQSFKDEDTPAMCGGPLILMILGSPTFWALVQGISDARSRRGTWKPSANPGASFLVAVQWCCGTTDWDVHGKTAT